MFKRKEKFFGSHCHLASWVWQSSWRPSCCNFYFFFVVVSSSSHSAQPLLGPERRSSAPCHSGRKFALLIANPWREFFPGVFCLLVCHSLLLLSLSECIVWQKTRIFISKVLQETRNIEEYRRDINSLKTRHLHYKSHLAMV